MKRWLKNISIKQKLYLVLIIMALLVASELFTLWFAIKTLSAVRAFIAGEGIWSKAQKDAVYYLNKYARTRNSLDYHEFMHVMKIPDGYKNARIALQQSEPDLEAARKGLLQGHSDHRDVENMIWLYLNFGHTKYIARAMNIWQKGEPLLLQLLPIGEKLHQEIVSAKPDLKRINLILSEIDPINDTLFRFENDFSGTLGEGSRWLEDIILEILIFIAITVELTGILLTISVNVNISKGVSEIVRVSHAIEKNDLTERARIFSQDEIGKLAEAFNKMLDDLNRHVTEQKEAEEKLKMEHETLEEYTTRLEENNKELERLAYVTSHHLREPLRAISSYVQLIDSRYKDKLDKDAKDFIGYVVESVNRMDRLTRDLSQYVQLSRQDDQLADVDCNEAVKAAFENLKSSVENSHATISVNKLPVVPASKRQVVQLFQNLISNAIKFNRGLAPEIKISSAELETHWLFSVRDNGIGIDPKYSGKIFDIFQRLNLPQQYDGTGIGLTICKKIVEKHGGMIWVDSDPGKGSVFYFTISKKKNNNGNGSHVE